MLQQILGGPFYLLDDGQAAISNEGFNIITRLNAKLLALPGRECDLSFTADFWHFALLYKIDYGKDNILFTLWQEVKNMLFETSCRKFGDELQLKPVPQM